MKLPHLSITRRAFLAILLLGLAGCATNPNHVYLTWQGDPSTTMTVNFHSAEAASDLTLHYDTESRGGEPGAYRYAASGASRQIPGLKDGRHIHHVEATELEPGATYHFVLADGSNVLTEELRFRPLPGGNAPLRFISGGDMAILPRSYQIARLAGGYDPMFALIGGDMAYADGKLKNAWMWDRWLGMWEEHMVTADGVMIPMVLAIGNHEVNKLEGPPEVRAPFYYGYFPQGGRSYFTLPLRDDTILIVLDSGHTVPHHGAQAEWLDEVLGASAGLRNTIAVYHAPLYPSHRDYEDGRAVQGRTHWLPIFDKHGLRVAFENHDHTFKRTKVLRGGAVAESGTVYLGDGSMGVNPRPVQERWYLEKASGTPHFWLCEIDDTGMRFRAISAADDLLDDLTLD